MAMGGFGGLQFQPGVPQNGEKTANGQRGRLQEPVQVLSTRLPKFFGGGALAPAALLQSQGGMGQPAARGNVVAQALAQLAGLPPGMPSPAGQGSLPMAGGMFGMGDAQTAAIRSVGGSGGSWTPSPPMLPPYNPPPPVFTPGDQPGQPPPIMMPPPGPQPPPIKEEPPLRIGGQLPPPTIVRDDGETFPREGEDVIRMLASRLFR